VSLEARVDFLGAARTVTGSQHLLSVNGHRVLLDCGLFQGKRREAFERNRTLPFDASSVDALILSHAHIDHSGNIPNLVRNGFRGSIYCTFATRDLCSAMLRDSAHIQERDVRYVNKKRARKGEPPVEPIYTDDDVISSLHQFVGIGYNRAVEVIPGVACTLLDAGHILGSAAVYLEMRDGSQILRLLFSGDLGPTPMPIVRDPTPAPAADVLVIESTYGDRTHPAHGESERRLLNLMLDAYAKGGKVVIPSFAVGRTQGIVFALHEFADRGELPDVPVFVDSPLAVNVTEVFRLHPECYDDETRAFMAEDRHPDPFGFDMLRYVRRVEDSKALNDLDGPAVIISASGMCEGGRVQHHLKNTIEDPRNAVCIVGWQAPHTLGRRLVERQPVVRIFGDEYRLRARVEVLGGYSAHADRPALLSWVEPIADKLRQACVVHGELGPATSLAHGLEGLGATDVVIPEMGDSVYIGG
jgi:metallo-beta-lactamase family protein